MRAAFVAWQRKWQQRCLLAASQMQAMMAFSSPRGQALSLHEQALLVAPLCSS